MIAGCSSIGRNLRYGPLGKVLVVREKGPELGQEILLGLWQPGAPMGLAGRYTGPLGLWDSSVDATLEDAACRHLSQLTGLHVLPGSLHKRAVFMFDDELEEHEYYCGYEHANRQERLTDTKLMRCEWFSVDEIPYDQMPADDSIWYPHFLRSVLQKGYFNFSPTQPLLIESCRVVAVTSLDADDIVGGQVLSCMAEGCHENDAY